jgi:hypothetical protein
MDNATARKPLPTTVAAVDADLRARADFRGIDEFGKVYYLLGMCEALLAKANAEIERLMIDRARRRVGGDYR